MPNYRSPTHPLLNNPVAHPSSPINNSPSQVYSESLDQEPSYLTEEISQVQQDQQDVDSLMDVSEEELEQRALELLADDNNNTFNNTTLDSSDYKGVGKNGWDLPRILTLDSEEESLNVLAAQTFLRKCLIEAEESDWIYNLPDGSSSSLANGRTHKGGEGEGDGIDWIDKAFNLESYRPGSIESSSSSRSCTESTGGEEEEESELGRFGEEDTTTFEERLTQFAN